MYPPPHRYKNIDNSTLTTLISLGFGFWSSLTWTHTFNGIFQVKSLRSISKQTGRFKSQLYCFVFLLCLERKCIGETEGEGKGGCDEGRDGSGGMGGWGERDGGRSRQRDIMSENVIVNKKRRMHTIVQPLDIFDSASLETSFIKIKGTLKIGLIFSKNGHLWPPNGPKL